VLESWAVILQYAAGYAVIWDFLDTFSYNFGLIYDTLFNTLLELFHAIDTTGTNYFMVGYGLGNLLYLIFFSS